MTISPSTIIQQNPDIIASEIDGETVMMDTNFEKYFGLEAIGTSIWQRLAEPMPLETLCQQLTEEFEVGYEQCLQDVTPFIESLLEQEMLTQS